MGAPGPIMGAVGASALQCLFVLIAFIGGVATTGITPGWMKIEEGTVELVTFFSFTGFVNQMESDCPTGWDAKTKEHYGCDGLNKVDSGKAHMSVKGQTCEEEYSSDKHQAEQDGCNACGTWGTLALVFTLLLLLMSFGNVGASVMRMQALNGGSDNPQLKMGVLGISGAFFLFALILILGHLFACTEEFAGALEDKAKEQPDNKKTITRGIGLGNIFVILGLLLQGGIAAGHILTKGEEGAPKAAGGAEMVGNQE